MRSRQPPHQREAEAAVLGAVLLRNEVMNELVGLLEDQSFYVPAHQALFRAFSRLSERGEPIDIITVEAQLRQSDELNLVGGIEVIGKLADLYSTSHNVLAHAEIVKQAKVLRDMAHACSEIAEDARGEVPDFSAFVDSAERRFLELNQTHRKQRYQLAGALVGDTFKDMIERAKLKNAITGVPTGFHDLDNMMGGMQAGDLIIVAARPSMGKTAFAINIAQNCALLQQRDVMREPADRPPLFPALVVTMEMTSPQLIERILCSEARIDSSKMRAGRLIEPEFRGLVNAADRLHKSPICLIDVGAPSISEIRAEVRRFAADRTLFPPLAEPTRRPRGVIIVDYLQLARGSKKGGYDIREQEVAEISRGLKAMAKETNMPVVALSQLNRGVDSRADHRPNLGDLRESGAIEQDADVVLFVYREERYATTEEEKAKCRGEAEIIIGKQRNGPVGTVHLTFRGEYTRFENRAPDQYGS